MSTKNRLFIRVFVFAVLSLLLSEPSLCLAKDLSPLTGKVVGVSDGDTITVMNEGRGIKVRLAEIDCPEGGQDFGARAKQKTSDLCYGKIVTVKPTDVDRYNRIVAHVILPNQRNLNEEIVKAGLAWQYKQYSKSQKLADYETEARKAKIGIWSMPNPVAPWEWRRTSSKKEKTK